LLVLNKTDLVDAEPLAQTRVWLREITGPSTAIRGATTRPHRSWSSSHCLDPLTSGGCGRRLSG